MHKSEQPLNFSIRIPSRDVFREALMQFLEMRWKSSTNSLIRPQPRPPPHSNSSLNHTMHVIGGKMEKKEKENQGVLHKPPMFPAAALVAAPAFDILPHNNCAVLQFTSGMSIRNKQRGICCVSLLLVVMAAGNILVMQKPD